MSKKETLSRTKLRNRNNLLDAFGKLFPGKPLEKISVREITDAAGYNRSTFYLYFRDIYDLAEAYETSVLEEVTTVVGTIAKENASLPIEGLIAKIAPIAAGHIDRIWLCSQLPGFSEHFQKALAPLFTVVTGLDPKRPENSFLFSLLAAILLHNIAYFHDFGEELSIDEAVRISRSLIAPGLSGLIAENQNDGS